MVALAKVINRPPACAPASDMAADVLQGLHAIPKRLPPKYFYDEHGSQLFERITELPEYYPTRCELDILRDNSAAIAKLIPAGACLVEFGSGPCAKVRVLLRAAPGIAAYVPVDISAEFLEREAAVLRGEFPQLAVTAMAADFTQPFALPDSVRTMPKVGFFPGSTVGNFEPHEAAAFLRNVGGILGRDATFIVGVDLVKKAEVLNAAYNDAAGVTEAFNLNLLARLNRELGADFNLANFEHHAFYNRERNRIEMHLASSKRQRVRVCGECIDFRAGETIHTENSYKYSIESFGALARGSGWTPVAAWTDAKQYFSVQALKYRGEKPRRTALNGR
jgi:dimethylhistidine N-methyltransferase